MAKKASYPNKVRLVPVTKYADIVGVHRDTVHQRLVEGKLTAYETEIERKNTSGEVVNTKVRTFLNPEEKPPMVYDTNSDPEGQ